MFRLTALILAILFLQSLKINAQCGSPGQSLIGRDTIVVVKCLNDKANISSLYNLTGLISHWDIPNPAQAEVGYYRVTVMNALGCTDTAYVDVKLDVKKWIGKVDMDWHNPGNWSDSSIPGPNSHVLIFGNTPFSCLIDTADAFVASIRLKKQGQYAIADGKKLHVTGTCDTLPLITKLVEIPS